MFKRPMARKRGSRKKQYRRGKRATINGLKIAETLAMANLGTRSLFGVSIAEFLTGQVTSGRSAKSRGRNNSWEITLPELINGLMGGKMGMQPNWQAKGLGGAIQKNLTDMQWNEWVKFITIPIAFRVGRKVLAKPLINPINRGLRNLGVKEIKV